MNDTFAWFEKLKAFFLAGNDLILAFNTYLATRFGEPFQLAIDWVLVGVALVLGLRILKFSFDVLKYVLVPSVVLSGVVAVTTSLSFLYVMPIAMGVGTVLLIFKS